MRYRLGGQERRHTIGAASVLTLTEARQKARKALVAIDEGKDPTAEKANKHRRYLAFTLSSVSAEYLEAIQSSLKSRSHVECVRHLNKTWKPLHELAIGAVSRSTVAARLREVAKDRGNTASNRARATLSAMYSWAIRGGTVRDEPGGRHQQGGRREASR